MNHFLIRFGLALLSIMLLGAGKPSLSDAGYEVRVLRAQTEARMDAAKEIQQKDVQLLQQLGASQNEKIEQINHQVDWLGNLIALGSLVITLLLVLIGYFAYGKAKSDAEGIAKSAAKDEANTIAKAEIERWFNDNVAEVTDKLNGLEGKLKQLDAHAADARLRIDKAHDAIQAHASKIIAANPIALGVGSELTEADRRTLADASASLQDKPESTYTFDDWNTRAFAAYSKGNLALAAEYWKNAAQITDAGEEQIASVMFNQGVVLWQLAKYEDAIKCYQQLASRFSASVSPLVQEQVSKALVNQGIVLAQLEKLEEAISCYQEVVRRFADSPVQAVQEQVAKSLVNQGATFGQLGKHQEEVDCYYRIGQSFGDSPLPALQEQVAKALVNQGVAFGKVGKHEEELGSYQEIFRRFADTLEPTVQEQVAKALINQGVVLGRLGKREEELDCYLQLLHRFGDSTFPPLQEQVGHALVNQGAALWQSNKSMEALDVYQQIITRFPDSTLPGIQDVMAAALNGIGFGRLLDAKRTWGNAALRVGLLSESLGLLQQAKEKAQSVGLRSMVLGNVAYASWLLGREVEAEPLLHEALTLGGEKTRDDEIADVKISPVPPDSGFERLVNRLWREIVQEADAAIG
jgi:tetratricopeptide (TPR) repeat protein